MSEQSFTASFTVPQTPAEAFAGVTNPRGWWSEEIVGGTSKVGDEFTYAYGEAHRCTMKLTEVVPDQKVVWHVLENYFGGADGLVEDPEWKGTDVVFEISVKGAETEVRFTHKGLVPEFECYGFCSAGWNSYIRGSLPNLIKTGAGTPNKKGELPPVLN